LKIQKKDAMKKFKTCLKFGEMGNNPKIMGNDVVKNHRNSRNMHKMTNIEKVTKNIKTLK
jgi:hypothetical protein